MATKPKPRETMRESTIIVLNQQIAELETLQRSGQIPPGSRRLGVCQELLERLLQSGDPPAPETLRDANK
jgi:hypothetical protein